MLPTDKGSPRRETVWGVLGRRAGAAVSVGICRLEISRVPGLHCLQAGNCVMIETADFRSTQTLRLLYTRKVLILDYFLYIAFISMNSKSLTDC